jgi:hypothetical protein
MRIFAAITAVGLVFCAQRAFGSSPHDRAATRQFPFPILGKRSSVSKEDLRSVIRLVGTRVYRIYVYGPNKMEVATSDPEKITCWWKVTERAAGGWRIAYELKVTHCAWPGT